MTPWKIAMEAAADEVQGGVDRITHPDGRRAYFVDSADMAAVHVLNQAVASLRALPEPPAFRAALEADEALLREAAEHIKRLHMRAEDAVAVLCGMSAHPSDTADVAAGMLAGMLAGAADRASDLLAKLEERRG